jgi:CubicO group peptidase (beta-lactamase class C family)
MFRYILIAIVVLTVLSACRSPQTINSLVRLAVATQDIPGMAAAIISSDNIQSGVAGVREVGATTPIATTDRFHLGSNIKAMTAELAATLVDSGVIQWNTTVAQVFPELLADMRASYQSVTLAQLLTHRGGVLALTDPGDLAQIPSLPDDPVKARIAFSHWLLNQAPVTNAAGTAVYSNAGFVLAAAMLERKTGRDFESLLTDLVLRPLNVTPLFDWPAAHSADAPWGHERVAARWLPNDPDAVANQFPAALTPAGNLSLSVSDYARFIQSQLRGLRDRGGTLAPSTYRYLHTPQGEFALGWLVKDIAGVRTSAHDGSAGTFYAIAAIQPDRDRAVIVLINAYSDAAANAANQLALKLLELTP